jgi:hypothetical protein
MKKRLVGISVIMLSAFLLSACEEGKAASSAGLGSEVEIRENGSGADESRGRIEDGKREDDMGAGNISGSIKPSVSGSIISIDDGEEDMLTGMISSNTAKGKELMALVSSEEEALKIAELYGIEFVDFELGVACYHTEEDPSTVVQRGIDNGWPLVEVNGRRSLIE